MKHKKQVGLWVRVSTDMQGDSPEHHELRGRHYAEAKGWDIVKLYRLEAMSGKSVAGYAETKQMLEDIKNGVITGLVFSKLARLARNTKELLEFADLFKENDADLISLEESIDTTTPAGRMFYTMIAALGQWEREEISARVAASIPIRAKLGKFIGGKTSLGYKIEGTRLVIDEKEAPIRKLVFELYLKLKRRKAVARELNELGYRTRTGQDFSDTTVERLLTDPTAKGQHRANYTTWKGKRIVYKPESEWVIQPCPAIVSDEVWNECNQILLSQKKKQKVGKRPMHLLTGFVYCGPCNKKMYVFHDRSATYVCQTRKKRILASDLEEIFHGQLKTFLLTDQKVADYNKVTDALIKEKEQLLFTALEESQLLRTKMDDLFDLHYKRQITKERFAETYQPLEERIGQLDNQTPELQAEVDFLKIQYLSADTILHDAQTLYERWGTMEFEEKRNIVETITERITYENEDITFSLSYLPNLHFINEGNKQRSDISIPSLQTNHTKNFMY